MSKNWLTIQNKANGIGEIHVYGDIVDSKWMDEDTTPTDVKNKLDGMKDAKQINLFVNSPGGSVFAALAIYNMLKRFGDKVHGFVDGIAASSASVVLMAAKKITIPKNGIIMIHKPWSMTAGTSEDMRKSADLLDKVEGSIVSTYVDRGKITAEKASSLMEAETWMNAEEAVAYGLADVISEPLKIAASIRGTTAIINGVEMDTTKYRTFPKIDNTTEQIMRFESFKFNLLKGGI